MKTQTRPKGQMNLLDEIIVDLRKGSATSECN